MHRQLPIRLNRAALAVFWSACLCLPHSMLSVAKAQDAEATTPVVIDKVVAVVNNQAILASDLDNEIRLSVLDPNNVGQGVLTRAHALDELIGRDLIQQQIRQEDEQAALPSQAEVNDRLTEMRKQLPSCVRENCATEAGWKAFLAAHGLSQQRVENYLRYRLEILRFIEQRFRQGVSISQREIETYYHDTLLPQYATGETRPPLDQVSSRIQEILLQQRVNVMFDEWLENLRKQGGVEVLDPALGAGNPETPVSPTPVLAPRGPNPQQPPAPASESPHSVDGSDKAGNP
jgi:peptidyl-prolyl cis-trans isomerase SurA